MLKALQKRICSVQGFKYLALLLSFSLLLTAQVGTSLAFIVTNTPSLYNVFCSGLDPTGDLVIHKTVEHPFGAGYTIPENIAFLFDVNLGAENAGKTFDGLTADENGVITVTVKAGGTVALHGIPAGTSVTVTERQTLAGFSPKEAAAKTVVIEKGKRSALEFVNVYAPRPVQPVNLTVTGVKTLLGRDWQPGDSFTFQLELLENGGWVSLGVQTVVCPLPETEASEQPAAAQEAGFNRFDFTALLQGVSFDKAGVYSFRIREVEGSAGGVAYDETKSFFDVLVGDQTMDGSLEIQRVTTTSANTQIAEASGTFGVSVAFENRYAPVGSAEAVVRVQKTLADASGQKRAPAGFSFGLYDENGALLQTSLATSAAGEAELRLVFAPEDAGNTFTYYLKEINDEQTAVYYDKTVFALQVSVVDNLDGTVSALVCDAQQGGVGASNVFEAQFSNRYEPQSARATLGGVKLLTGRAIKAGEFTFDLYKTDSDFEIPAGAVPVSTAVNGGAEGAFSFDELTFDAVGTYYYAIVEDVSAPLGGIRYDTTKYGVVVSVTDAGGSLSADVTITNEDGEESALVFRNAYAATKAVVTLTGENLLHGAALTDGMFAFQLYQADASYTVQSDAIRTAVNNAAGEFAFDALTFDAPGTYYYVVAEARAAQAPGVTCDERVYGVMIDVCDNGAGSLLATTSLLLNGNPVEEIVFENTFTPAANEVAVIITAQKTVNNVGLGAIGPENFVFQLRNSETAASDTAISNADGVAAFALTFTQQDVGKTYSYQLSEVAGARKGVTYSDKVYEFEIAVSQRGDGQLQAVVLYNGEMAESFTAEFVNTYAGLGAGGSHGSPIAPLTGNVGFILLCAVLMAVSAAVLSACLLARQNPKNKGKKILRKK